MAVYTQVGAEEIAAFLTGYDAGRLVSAKGIAEGVENSNYLIETDQSRFILTLYEKRVDPDDLPFFIALLNHLSDAQCPVPRFIADKKGEYIQSLAGRPACLIEFLPGVSVSLPTKAQAQAAGQALGDLHQAARNFDLSRPNRLSHDGWRELADSCGADGLNAVKHGLDDIVRRELDFLDRGWPHHLEQSLIHADLFPDNVLMLGDEVTGLIDFYFSCTDIRAYDLAVTHAAWCFSEDGMEFDKKLSDALIEGYDSHFSLGEEERSGLLTLARGASLRFLLTRAYDWINTPAEALVTRKDPMAFLNRLQCYADPANAGLFL